MKKVKTYEEFLNEEISRKGIVKGALAATLGLGSIGAGVGYMRDKSIEPTEQTSSVKNEIPNNFDIDEKLLNIGHDFWITNDKRDNFGKIEQRMLSFGKKFEYFDNTGKLEATAKAEVLTIKTIINVEDSDGKKIGTIEQEILESIGNMLEGQNVYSILDANGNLIGKSKSDMIIKNNVDIYDISDRLIAKFHTPAVSFGARWKCEISSSNIDKRLLIFIPAYISSTSKSSSKRK